MLSFLAVNHPEQVPSLFSIWLNWLISETLERFKEKERYEIWDVQFLNTTLCWLKLIHMELLICSSLSQDSISELGFHSWLCFILPLNLHHNKKNRKNNHQHKKQTSFYLYNWLYVQFTTGNDKQGPRTQFYFTMFMFSSCTVKGNR